MRDKFFALAAVILSTQAWGAAGSLEESASGLISNVRVSGTDHVIVDGRKDPDDQNSPSKNLLMHEINLAAQYYNFSFAVDVTNRVGLDDYSSSVSAPFNLEKVNGKWQWGHWEVQLGDSHQEIGRGVALSLYRDDIFGIDNTLQGAYAHYRPDRWEASVFGGRIHSIYSPVAINPVDNTMLARNVWLGGGALAYDIDSDTRVGAHYFGTVEIPKSTGTGDAVWHTVGATVSRDGILENVDVYAESSVLLSHSIYNGRATALPMGIGSYGSLVWSANPWKVKWEVKDYRNDNFEFRRPPTLEEDIVLTLDVVDVTGSRWQVERRVGEHTTLQASYLVGYDRQLQGTINHGVLGAKFLGPWGMEVEARGGYRWIAGQENMVHGTLKAKLPTWKNQAFELSALVQYYNQRLNFTPTPDNLHRVGLTYSLSEHFNTGVGYEWVPTNSDSLGQNFFNVGGTYKAGALVARVFAGQTSGGTVCSGGVCRVVPPFTGALAETTYTF